MLASIVSIAEFNSNRPSGVIVATSGGFDPIHPGHIGHLMSAKELGDTLVVIVNGASFLASKKGVEFIPFTDRCEIVAAIKGVDYVIPFEQPGEHSVWPVLAQIKPHIFANGGDRIAETTLETIRCEHAGIVLEFSVGPDKKWASSDYLYRWDHRERG